MASWSQIKELRLLIADPSGIINILSIATSADLPASPEQQTAYYLADTAYYMITDLTSGAVPSSYRPAHLRVSDTYLADLIDTYGIDIAKCRAYAMIMTNLGNEMRIKKIQAGSDSTEYTTLKDLFDYYKKLRDDCEADNNKDNFNSTGRFYRSKQPRIAGGNL